MTVLVQGTGDNQYVDLQESSHVPTTLVKTGETVQVRGKRLESITDKGLESSVYVYILTLVNIANVSGMLYDCIIYITII